MRRVSGFRDGNDGIQSNGKFCENRASSTANSSYVSLFIKINVCRTSRTSGLLLLFLNDGDVFASVTWSAGR